MLLFLELVEHSLKEIVDFFNEFKHSNCFEGDYYDFRLRRTPILKVKLTVQDSDIMIAPSNEEVELILIAIVDELVESGVNVPRVMSN